MAGRKQSKSEKKNDNLFCATCIHRGDVMRREDEKGNLFISTCGTIGAPCPGFEPDHGIWKEGER